MWLYSLRDSPTGACLLTPPVSGASHTPGFFLRVNRLADRAVVFIDGNNWYHALCRVKVGHLARLDYRKICEKLLGPRQWVGMRYYSRSRGCSAIVNGY